MSEVRKVMLKWYFARMGKEEERRERTYGPALGHHVEEA